jgi:hypothetical protein
MLMLITGLTSTGFGVLDAQAPVPAQEGEVVLF